MTLRSVVKGTGSALPARRVDNAELIGFIVLSGYYQRKWHRRAHHRLALLAHYGSMQRPRRDSMGLTRQGIDVTFTYHTKRRWFS